MNENFLPIDPKMAFRLFSTGSLNIAAASFENDTDAMPFAWICPWRVDSVCAMIAPGHYTRRLIDRAGRFSLMLPSATIASVTMALGIRTKNSDQQKLEKSGAEFFSDTSFANIPLVHGCAAYAIFETVAGMAKPETGLVFGRALAAWADRRAFVADHWLDPAQIPAGQRPLVYRPGGKLACVSAMEPAETGGGFRKTATELRAEN